MAYVDSSEAYDNRGNLKAGLTMQPDGTISTQARAEDDEEANKVKAAAKKKKQARENAHAWGSNALHSMGLGKVADMDQPAWFAPIEEFFVNSGLFGEKGMIVLTPGSKEESEGSKEMEYDGYQTQNFYMCPGALETFSKIKQMGLRGKEQDCVTYAIEMVDAMLGIEVVLKKYGGDSQDLYLMMMLNNKVFYVLGKLWNMSGIDFLNGFTFMADHIATAASIVYGEGEDQMMSKEDDGIHVGEKPSDENRVVKAIGIRVKK